MKCMCVLSVWETFTGQLTADLPTPFSSSAQLGVGFWAGSCWPSVAERLGSVLRDWRFCIIPDA